MSDSDVTFLVIFLMLCGFCAVATYATYVIDMVFGGSLFRALDRMIS